jgi:uncharacterized membrane protein YvbJ
MFCPNCGKAVGENDKFCPYCATPLQASNQPVQQSPVQQASPPSQPAVYTSAPLQTAEKVSNLWFLVPIIFSIFGGIVAYFMVRKRDPNKAALLIGIGALIFIIEILFL